MIATAIAMMVLMKTYTTPLKHDSTYYITTTNSEHLAQYISSWEKNRKKTYPTKSAEHISFTRKNQKYTDTTEDATTTTPIELEFQQIKPFFHSLF